MLGSRPLLEEGSASLDGIVTTRTGASAPKLALATADRLLLEADL